MTPDEAEAKAASERLSTMAEQLRKAGLVLDQIEGSIMDTTFRRWQARQSEARASPEGGPVDPWPPAR
jgi:hypothetical protein